MTAGMASSACSSGVIDIVCGTLQKLSGSSRCIQYGSLLSPCDFQRQARKAAARNWIRYMDKPLSRVLESFVAPDGKALLPFCGLFCRVNLLVARSPSSQLICISVYFVSCVDLCLFVCLFVCMYVCVYMCLYWGST